MQAVAGEQGSAGAGLPPGQKRPSAHCCVALAALVEPAAQPKPGGAAQAPEQAALASPGAAPYVPAGQSCPASCEQSNGAVLTLSAATALSATCTTGPHASTAPPQGWHTETG